MATISVVRPSPIAGLWYAGEPRTLRQQVENYLAQAAINSFKGDVVGLVAPHAGHRYSGQTAGYAYRCVQGMEVDLVVIVSPFHDYLPSDLITSAHQAYSTPLGVIQIDQEAMSLMDKDCDAAGLTLTSIPNDREHSLEIQLPFLQCALKGSFKLMPLMLRSQSPQLARTLGHILADILRSRRVLLVASTDLSHFYPEKVADTLDAEMMKQIESFSPEGVLETERTGKGFACGAYPVASVLWAARELGANAIELLHHSTSGKETGDYESVVGYGAAVILKR